MVLENLLMVTRSKYFHVLEITVRLIFVGPILFVYQPIVLKLVKFFTTCMYYMTMRLFISHDKKTSSYY